MTRRYTAFTELLEKYESQHYRNKRYEVSKQNTSPPPLAGSNEYAVDFVKFIIRCDGLKWLVDNLNL
jgi:hypothetical protein